ncbi:MAG: hypothetical protein JKX92_14610 [Porticoccaceae bacterium]|nr:hypothetical protein [Porticoccaceae bacterium]
MFIITLSYNAPIKAEQLVAIKALSLQAAPQALKQLLEAPDLKPALTMAKGCPIVASGGSVEVAETMDMYTLLT